MRGGEDAAAGRQRGGVCWGSQPRWAEHIVSPTPWEGSGIPPGWVAAGIGALAKRIVERPWRWDGSEVLGALQPEEHWHMVREGAGRAASRLSLSVWQQSLRMEQAMGWPWGWVSCLGALQDAEPFAGGFSPAGREEAQSLRELSLGGTSGGHAVQGKALSAIRNSSSFICVVLIASCFSL